jgi:hypothetical protein
MRLRRRKTSRFSAAGEQPPRRRRESPPRAPRTPARAAIAPLADLVAIGREIIAWPVRILLGIALVARELALAVWRLAALPLLRLGRRLLRAGLIFGEREVTPARGLAVVALAATVALGASQFRDYRAVEVGAPEYRNVQNVAPAPEVDAKSSRSAHGVAVFAIAVVSLFVTVFAVGRNWRLARLLIFLGAAVIVTSLLIDAPKGLDEGTAGIAYQGAKATLLGAFWAQLACGVVLMVTGPLLALQLRGERRARRARRPRRVGDAGVAAGSFGAQAGGSGAEGAAT